ncbi:hypothetical protein HY501_00170 [Candidatus Woesearchaeota archaeon]|nr:hypothetical protein [Candidatus Woesearchaeota archaeon]
MQLGRIVSWILRGIIAVLSMDLLFSKEFIAAMIYIFIFLLSLLPILINEVYDVELHWLYDLLFVLMLAMHMLGFGGLYEFVPAWDDLGHLFGSAVITFFGFSFFTAMKTAKKLRITLPFIGFLSVLLTVTLGALWEILEFLWDNIVVLSFSYGFAQNSLYDTMIDIVFDFTSAIIISLLLVFLVKHFEQKTAALFRPVVKIWKVKAS